MAAIGGACGKASVAALAVLALLLVAASPALADRSFATRFSANDTGAITIAANALETCATGVAGCSAAQNASPGQGTSYDNNDFNMTYVNTAPGTFGGATTFDSSSAQLSIPAGATVLFAGLYWSGDTSKGTTVSGGGPAPAAAPSPSANNQVGLRTPTAGAYAAVTASQLDVSSSSSTRYSAFANVTAQVRAGGAGTYSVANVQAGTGSDRYAGWSLVVVYHDSSLPARNLTVDDGLVTVSSSGKPVSVPVGGFQTPPTGTVATTLGVVAWEGDTDLTGDSLSLNGSVLSDAGSPAGNFFDGGITDSGVNVTSRDPAYKNNMAVDAKLVSATGVLPNGATSATVTFTTNGDTYYPSVLAFQTDLYAPDIRSAKSVTDLTTASGPARHGDTLRYTLSYTNDGQDPATNFVTTDPIPTGTTFKPGSLRITAGPQAGASPTDAVGDDTGEYSPGADAVVFRLGAGATGSSGGTIAPGETDTVTFEVTVDRRDVDGQQLVNQAHATFLGKTLGTAYVNDTPTVVTTVGAPDLTLFKSDVGGFTGGTVTPFTLTVSNIGSIETPDGQQVKVVDTLPSDAFDEVTAAHGDGWDCAVDGLTVTCTRSDSLAAGASYPSIEIDARLTDLPPLRICNSATVSGAEDSNPTNDTGSDCDPAVTVTDVSIQKFAQAGAPNPSVTGELDGGTSTRAPATVYTGGTVTFTLPVTNLGPSRATDVTVRDTLSSDSYANVVATSTQGTCTTDVSCSLGDIPAYGTATVTIVATVIARNTTLNNVAAVHTDTPDANVSNNRATARVTVPASADLELRKTGDGSDPQAGQPYTYTVTVTDRGPDAAQKLSVEDQLPSTFTATSAAGGGFSCTIAGGPGGTLHCTRPSLSVADGPQAITVTGTFAAPGGRAEQAVNAAVVSSETPDPDATNNSDTVILPIEPQAALTLTKRALLADDATPVTEPLSPGQSFYYELGVTNFGPSTATGVTVTDALPPQVAVPAGATLPGGCVYAAASNTVTCTFASIPVGSQYLEIPVQVGGAAGGGEVVNSATVASETPDPNPDDNTGRVVVGVDPVSDLELAKGVSTPTAAAGETVTYTLTVTNRGDRAGGATVTDELPAGLTFERSSDCSASGRTVTCGPLRVPAGTGSTVTASYTARVDAGHEGATLVNTATVAPADAGSGYPKLPELDLGNNTAHAELAVGAPGRHPVPGPEADLAISKRPSRRVLGAAALEVYRLKVTNHGPDAAANLLVRDRIPRGLAFVDAGDGCVNRRGTLECRIERLASGRSATIKVTFRVLPRAAGSLITNTAAVSSGTHDPSTRNDRSTAKVTVRAAKRPRPVKPVFPVACGAAARTSPPILARAAC